MQKKSKKRINIEVLMCHARKLLLTIQYSVAEDRMSMEQSPSAIKKVLGRQIISYLW